MINDTNQHKSIKKEETKTSNEKHISDSDSSCFEILSKDSAECPNLGLDLSI